MRAWMAVSIAALGLSGVAAPLALADDPPPITVPTPTVPVPQPDPGPVAKPRPKPQGSTRPAASRPAATPPRPVTRTYRPARATVVPHTRVSRPATKKKAAVKKHKAKAKPKPAAATKLPPRHGVKGKQKTLSNATAVVASHGGSSHTQTNLLRTGLLLAVASALGVMALLFMSESSPRTATAVRRRKRLAVAGVRRRLARPREVGVEVIRPKELRGSIPLPPVPPPAEEVAPSVAEELPSHQLLADIAPTVAEPPASDSADQEVPLEPGPEPETTRAWPILEPAVLAQSSAARQKQLVEERPASFEETPLPLQSAQADADKGPVTRPVEEICEIGIWRGYVKSRFYAGLIGAEREGIEFALAESLPVRLRGNGTPERTGEAAKAHEALVNYLIESGWEVEPSRNGEGWYALRFRRAAAPAESASA